MSSRPAPRRGRVRPRGTRSGSPRGVEPRARAAVQVVAVVHVGADEPRRERGGEDADDRRMPDGKHDHLRRPSSSPSGKSDQHPGREAVERRVAAAGVKKLASTPRVFRSSNHQPHGQRRSPPWKRLADCPATGRIGPGMRAAAGRRARGAGPWPARAASAPRRIRTSG